VEQNIKETTFGQIDPQKLAKVIPAAAVGVAGALAGKIPFNIPFDPGTGGITAFTASAYGIGRALGVRKKRKRTNHNSTRRQRIRDTKKGRIAQADNSSQESAAFVAVLNISGVGICHAR
jgi:hypothetical protein